MHDGSIAIRMTLKTFTPCRDRLGYRRERRGGLFDSLTIVANNAPAPVRATGNRDSEHVHQNHLGAQLTRVRETGPGQARYQRVRRLVRLLEARWQALPG